MLTYKLTAQHLRTLAMLHMEGATTREGLAWLFDIAEPQTVETIRRTSESLKQYLATLKARGLVRQGRDHVFSLTMKGHQALGEHKKKHHAMKKAWASQTPETYGIPV